MAHTAFQEVLESFESSFMDKNVPSRPLEYEWFKKAVGYYSLEVGSLNFDSASKSFDKPLQRYTIDCLALLMKVYYQERELSRVDKTNNIIGTDVSFNSTGDAKKAAKAELDYIKQSADELCHKLKSHSYN